MTKEKRIIVLGKTGQIATALQEAMPSYGFHAQFFGREDVDFLDPSSLQRLEKEDFDILINAVAYTAVDKAEEDASSAWQVNAHFVGEVAQLCRRKNALLVHYSTDYVYDPEHDYSISEKEPCHPRGNYARSKWDGEENIRASGCRYLILRTSWVFAPWGQNFVKTISHLAHTRDHLRIVADQTGSPSYAPDIAHATLQVLTKINLEDKIPQETYNLSNTGYTTWYAFAEAIIKDMPKKPTLEPITYAEYGQKTPRPANSRLDGSHIQEVYGIQLRPWQQALDECLHRIHR